METTKITNLLPRGIYPGRTNSCSGPMYLRRTTGDWSSEVIVEAFPDDLTEHTGVRVYPDGDIYDVAVYTCAAASLRRFLKEHAPDILTAKLAATDEADLIEWNRYEYHPLRG